MPLYSPAVLALRKIQDAKLSTGLVTLGQLGPWFFVVFKRSEPWFCCCFLIINCLNYDYCIYIYNSYIYIYNIYIHTFIYIYLWILYTYYWSECILFLFWLCSLMYVYTVIYWMCCFTLLGLWLLPSWSDMSWSKAIFITVWLKHYVQLVSLNGCLLGRSLSIWMYLVYVQSLLWFQDLPFFVVGISDIGGTKACRCSLQKVCRFQYETKNSGVWKDQRTLIAEDLRISKA